MATQQRILVIGGGALGVLAALNLEASLGVSVSLVLRSNFDVVSKHGYDIKSCDHGELRNWRPAEVLKAIPHISSRDVPFDYIVVATKVTAGSSRHMSELIAPAVSPGHTTIVLIQNGVNIERPYFDRFPQNVVLSGVSYAGSQEVEYGKISHGHHDELFLGAFSNPHIENARELKVARHFASLYAASGKASCHFTSDTQLQRWKKIVYNATMNPLCAITGLDSGSLRQAGPSLLMALESAMNEILAVAKAIGHTLPKDLPQTIIEMDLIEDHFVPSMLQDVRKGNLTEFECLVGEPLREGARLGIPMPTMSVLYALCQALQFKIAQRYTCDGI